MTYYRRIIVLLLVVLVTGCSALRLGYRHADTYFAWRVDDYFDLDQRQKRDFNERLGHLLAWHRYEQLPEYAVFVNTAIKKAQPELKREDMIWFIDGIKARYQIIVDRGAGDAAELLMSITPEQIAALQKQWNKDNQKFVREYALEGSLGDRKLARLKRAIEQVEDWTGNLNSEQEQKIAVLLEAIPHINHLRHQDRVRRQKEFLELLKMRANQNEFQSRLHAWLRNWEHGRTSEYAQLSEEVFEKRIQFTIAVEKLLTPAQRHTAVQRLQNFADDFNTLSKKKAQAEPFPGSVVELAFSCFLIDACVPA